MYPKDIKAGEIFGPIRYTSDGAAIYTRVVRVEHSHSGRETIVTFPDDVKISFREHEHIQFPVRIDTEKVNWRAVLTPSPSRGLPG